MVRWKTDAESPYCQTCKQTFHLFLRRHHCRACVGTFCHACSEYRAPVPGEGHSKEVRVCRDCFVSVQTNVASLTLIQGGSEAPIYPGWLDETPKRHPGTAWRALVTAVGDRHRADLDKSALVEALYNFIVEEEETARWEVDHAWRSLLRTLCSIFYVFVGIK